MEEASVKFELVDINEILKTVGKRMTFYANPVKIMEDGFEVCQYDSSHYNMFRQYFAQEARNKTKDVVKK